MSLIRAFLLGLACLAGASLAEPTELAAGWWDSGFCYRRAVSTHDPISGRAASDVAAVEFTTFGAMRDDGGDVRVVDGSGAVLPRTVLTAGDDRAVVLFAAKPRSRYFVYFGNPEAASPPDSFEPRAFLVLEVRALPRGQAATLEEAMQLWSASPLGFGRVLAPTIAYGFNPLGPPGNVLLRFTGWLHCPEDGLYEFATNSCDASFLLVDGTVAAEWGGWHSARGGEGGKHGGTVHLAKGEHKVEYVNAVRDLGFGCVAGWRPPGANRIEPIPPRAWVGGLAASVGAIEAREGPAPADFSWSAAGDLGLEAREVTGLFFRARPVPGAVSWRWDFGDGTGSEEQAPTHVFLENATYTARLEVRLRDGSVRVGANRLRVQPQGGPGAHAVQRHRALFAKIVRDYPAGRLSGRAALEAGRLLADAGELERAAPAVARAVAAGAVDLARPEHVQAVEAVLDLYRARGELPRAIALAEALAANAAGGPKARAFAALVNGEALRDLGDLDGAEAQFRAAIEAGGQTEQARLARIRIGDILLARGKREEAAAVYRQAESEGCAFFGDAEIARGRRSVSFHSYLRSGDFAAAEREVHALLLEFPSLQLRGVPSLFLGKLREAQKRFEEAALEYGRAAEADPAAPVVPEALIGLARARESLGRRKAAIEALERCVRDYPESAEADGAKKMLDRLRGAADDRGLTPDSAGGLLRAVRRLCELREGI